RSGAASLQSQFRHDVLVGDAAVLAAGLGRPANVGLILQRLQRSVEELRRDDNSPATALASGRSGRVGRTAGRAAAHVRWTAAMSHSWGSGCRRGRYLTSA